MGFIIRNAVQPEDHPLPPAFRGHDEIADDRAPCQDLCLRACRIPESHLKDVDAVRIAESFDRHASTFINAAGPSSDRSFLMPIPRRCWRGSPGCRVRPRTGDLPWDRWWDHGRWRRW